MFILGYCSIILSIAMKEPVSRPMPLKLEITITGESIEDLLIAIEEVWGSVEGNFLSGYGGTVGSSFNFEIIENELE